MDDAYRRERMGDKLADVTDPQSDRALAWWGKKPNSPLHCLRRDDCECEIEVESVNPPDETHSPTQIFTYIPPSTSPAVSQSLSHTYATASGAHTAFTADLH
jgi:hypothetical protein